MTRFPPRAQLPPGVTIERLPGLGTTWYERDPSYWARRTGAAIGCAVILALWTVIVGAFVRDSGPAGSPAFLAVLTAEIVLSIITGVWQFRRIWKHPAPWPGNNRKVARDSGLTGAGLGALARAGNILAIAVLTIVALLTYGMMLAVFAISLMPVLPRERDARARLTEELRRHRHPGHEHKPAI